MNVFVILADSFRADFLGAYGNDWVKTPNLDDFAEEATLFEEAYSENMPTLPMRQTAFTGRFGLPFRRWQPLDVKMPVLAEVLWDEGFRTCITSDTFPMFDRNREGKFYSRGFESVNWIWGQMDSAAPSQSTEVNIENYIKEDGTSKSDSVYTELTDYFKNRKNWRDDEDHFVAKVVKESMKLLDRKANDIKGNGGDDLFFWIDIFDPHEPWDPVAPYDTMYGPLLPGNSKIVHPVARTVEGYLNEREEEHIRNQYAGLCTIVDKWLGVLFDYLKREGYFDNSLIIFLSDHGEPLGRGKWGHGIVRKCRPWPYRETAHIPLIIRHPELGKGERAEGFVQTCDLTATILDYLQFSPLEGMHGKSLLPLMNGRLEEMRDFAISGYHKAAWSIRTKDWSYILWRPEANRNQIPDESLGAIQCVRGGTLETPGRPELYNRTQDPYELNNLVEDRPNVANRIELKLRRFIESLTWS